MSVECLFSAAPPALRLSTSGAMYAGVPTVDLGSESISECFEYLKYGPSMIHITGINSLNTMWWMTWRAPVHFSYVEDDMASMVHHGVDDVVSKLILYNLGLTRSRRS